MRSKGWAGCPAPTPKTVEQVLIEFYGLEKNGGTLQNKINSIALSNPIYRDSLERGRELLKEAGYRVF
jgi:filamentous hemagglutinin